MSTSHFCRNCKHRLTIPGFNGEPTTYFCTSELTKQRQPPIGYISEDSPACEHFDSRHRRSAGATGQSLASENKTVYYITLPPGPNRTGGVSEGKPIDVVLIEKIGMISTIVVAIALAFEHLKPYLVLIFGNLYQLLHR